MGATPEELRARIERTRQELTSDIDTIADRTSPAAIARRRTQAVRSGIGGARDRVMGGASSASDSASGAPSAVAGKAQGNPMAAGLIAFGLGLLVSTLIPTTEAEENAGAAIKDSDLVDTVKSEAQAQAQQAKDALVPAAQEHAQQVKAGATDAAQATADHAKSAGQDVADDARSSADELKS